MSFLGYCPRPTYQRVALTLGALLAFPKPQIPYALARKTPKLLSAQNSSPAGPLGKVRGAARCLRGFFWGPYADWSPAKGSPKSRDSIFVLKKRKEQEREKGVRVGESGREASQVNCIMYPP